MSYEKFLYHRNSPFEASLWPIAQKRRTNFIRTICCFQTRYSVSELSSDREEISIKNGNLHNVRSNQNRLSAKDTTRDSRTNCCPYTLRKEKWEIQGQERMSDGSAIELCEITAAKVLAFASLSFSHPARLRAVSTRVLHIFIVKLPLYKHPGQDRSRASATCNIEGKRARLFHSCSNARCSGRNDLPAYLDWRNDSSVDPLPPLLLLLLLLPPLVNGVGSFPSPFSR